MPASYVVADPIIGNPFPVTRTDTSQMFPLGLVVRAVDQQSGSTNLGAGQFQYCVGYSTASAVSSAGQWVQIRGNTAWLLLAAQSASKFPVGVAAGALSNTNVYGWVQVHGIADYVRGTNQSLDAGKPHYICAGTGGILVSDVVNGNQVLGAVPVSSLGSNTVTSGAAIFYLNYPNVPGLTQSL